MRVVFVPALLLGVTITSLPAQTYTVLNSFTPASGAVGYNPKGSLVQALDGSLYGTTSSGSTGGGGALFSITPGGTLTTEYGFCPEKGCLDGGGTQGSLIQGTNGYLYGPATSSIFKTSQAGSLTTPYSGSGICPTNSTFGPCGLAESFNGSYFATVTFAGQESNACNFHECGAIVQVGNNGSSTVLYSFCSQSGCSDGYQPVAPLVQTSDGNFYGLTSLGGATCDPNAGGGCGTFFKLTPGGVLTTLHQFCSNPDGQNCAYPLSLVLSSDGNFYGITTSFGGSFFKITPAGELTTIVDFTGSGVQGPNGLIQASDGNFYGTALAGGTNFSGAIFRITPSGKVTLLHSFCASGGCSGVSPYKVLVQATDGNFYGTTAAEGDSDGGTVFRLSLGLPPFVKPLLSAGKVGGVVQILGTNLTGATSVRFNGTTAPFKVVSGSYIVAKVPAGATTGKITVVTPEGALLSNVLYHVLP